MTQYQALNQLVRSWDRRLRMQQSVAWLARGVIPGLTLGIIAGGISRIRPFLSNTEVALFTSMSVMVGVAALLLLIWLRDREPVIAARRFDRTFGLKERVSTALELLEGRIPANEQLATLQTQDAYIHAQAIHAEDQLKLQIRYWEWGMVGVLFAIVLALILIPNTIEQVSAQQAQQRALIEEGIEDIQEAIEAIAADTTLDEATRQDLLQTLEASLDTLQDANITIDEALATLGDIEDMLIGEANQLRESAAQTRAALEDAAQTLSQTQQSEEAQADAGAAGGDQSTEEDLAEALEQLAQDAQQMSEEAQTEAADAVEDAAEMLSDTVPQAAEAMRQAAQSMREGDNNSASEALMQAAQQVENALENQQDMMDTANQLEQSANQVNETQQRLEQEGGQPFGEQPQDSGQSQSGQQSQTGQDGEQSDTSQQAQSGQQGTAGEDPNSPEQSSAESQSGQGLAGQPDSEQAGENTGEMQQGSSQGEQSNNTQVGDQSANLQQANADTQAPDGPQEGSGGEGGERDYEAVFAPNRPGGSETDIDLMLDPDTSNAPIQEGDFTDNPEGQSVVPYNQVFRQYAESANQALERGYIPLGLRDVVREYFTSLDPSRTNP
ncbi:MAG: hypothetical protein CUN56_09170 [Phototrophicales bacterium]|nr:MAG: hypothetical protein CUN56_09170 [Phototrophicales bacterium]